ncbi:hypothetical protein LTR04_005758, partial [Oleoguttula sp. CCFEE 6159]
MGVDTRRPPLPAPTDVSSADNESALDTGTSVSRRTDHTSYSLPEDGRPITISTQRVKGDKEGVLTHGRHKSQTSLLIEYFEGGKSGDKQRTRPSVRVKVTPSSARKSKTANDHIQITGVGKDRKPSYTRRISLGNKHVEDSRLPEGTEISHSSESNLSGLPPVEIEVLNHNNSDLSTSNVSRNLRYVQNASDISSMPPESMLEGNANAESSRKERSRSAEREEVMAGDTLKTPSRRRSRSLSRERITQKVMEKLGGKPRESSSRLKHDRERRSSKENQSEETGSSRRRRSSKSHREEDTIPGAESGLSVSQLAPSYKSGDQSSFRSGTSKSSINNPKLLETVEDAIRRLILPELTALKEEQKTEKNRRKFEQGTRDSMMSDDNVVHEDITRRVSKSSSAPYLSSKPKVVLNRSGDDPGTVLSRGDSERKKLRKSSRESNAMSERSYARQGSADFTVRDDEQVHRKRSKDKYHLSEAPAGGVGGGILTAAALRHHDSHGSSVEKEKKRKSSKSRSRTASVTESAEEAYRKEDIPPMPMASQINDSELTRESILSADTERPQSHSSRGFGTPVQEVSRNSPREIAPPSSRTPTRTPTSLQKAIGTHHKDLSQGEISLHSARSDQDISTKARVAALGAAGLTGAALSHEDTQHEGAVDHADDDQYVHYVSNQEVSPVPSVTGYRYDRDSPLIPTALRPRSAASYSSAGREANRKQSNHSIHSTSSSPSSRHGSARKRSQAVDLEPRLEKSSPGHRELDTVYEPQIPKDESMDMWYEEQHKENERYRHSYDDESQRDSETIDYKRMTNYTDDSMDAPHLDRVAAAQDIRGVGANPEYVHTLVAVESAVASLLDPSLLSSVRSSEPSSQNHGQGNSRSRGTDDFQRHAEYRAYTPEHATSTQSSSPSKDRWAAIKGHARTLSEKSSQDRTVGNSPQRSVAESSTRSQREQGEIRMGASGIPVADDPMPEIGHGLDDESDLNTNPSIIQGPLGGVIHGNQDHWPYGETPPLSSRNLQERQDEHEYQTSREGETALLGAGAAAGLGVTAADQRLHSSEGSFGQQVPAPQATAKGDNKHDGNHDAGHSRDMYLDRNATPTSPAHFKDRDEGYISAVQPRSPVGLTPEPYKEASKLYDDDEFEASKDGMGTDDPFVSQKRARYLSGNSHGMASPLYDSSTGQGIDRIQSKDVVALMDHLTVRDAQRNARDTEILVTLVRSAAEMRNSFEEMRRFIAEQDRMIMHNTDKDAEITVQKVLGGPRPQPFNSPRTSRRVSEEADDIPSRRKNVFKRALKGLSMKNSNDLTKIEDMLMQLLGDVEVLKESHGVHQPPMTHTTSLDSYEKLRSAPDPGYEPEGQAGTSSTPNHSGYLSTTPTRERIPMRSGYDGRRGSPNRISTVIEGDEDELEPYEEELLGHQFENNERMLTPTQEVRRGNSVPLDTPPQQNAHFNGTRSNDHTPKTEKQRKH